MTRSFTYDLPLTEPLTRAQARLREAATQQIRQATDLPATVPVAGRVAGNAGSVAGREHWANTLPAA